MRSIKPIHALAVLLAFGLAVVTTYFAHHTLTTEEKVADPEGQVLESELAAPEPSEAEAAPEPMSEERQRLREYLANWPWTDDRSTHAPYIHVLHGAKSETVQFQPPSHPEPATCSRRAASR